ncbi:hypothetical protein BVRB_5g118380 [Beta vulgaris subsp. vulgaris]|nr:hypothetical protein BVRB_5g118380 [Beta vulgaris subsp. vulgaris]
MRKMFVFLVLMVTVWETCNGANCNNLNVMDLLSCRSAVTLTKPTNPSPECCKTIKGLSADNIQCVCGFIKVNNGTWVRSFGVDPDRVMHLSALCNISGSVHC